MVYYKISRRKKVIYGVHEDLGILLERYPDVFTGVFVLTQYCQAHEKRDAWVGHLTFFILLAFHLRDQLSPSSDHI